MPKKAVLFLFLLLALSVPARGATFTVTTTADSGAGSLRQALLDANASPGLDTIAFAIPGPGVHTIAPASVLPAATSPVIIDGTTQPDYAGQPLIEMTGNYIPVMDCFRLLAGSDGSTIRGLVLNRFAGNAILIDSSHGHVIAGNYIGTDATGTAAEGSHTGVAVVRSNGTLVGGTTPEARNVISANTRGVEVSFSSSTVIAGNFFSTDVTGTALINDPFNIDDMAGSTGTVIGGTAPGARNIIAGRGVTLFGTNATVIGNYFGTDVTGTVPLVTFAAGIGVHGNGNRIGGPTAAERNVIIGGSGGGIFINAGSSHQVLGNYIGLGADGVTPLRPGVPTTGIVVRNLAVATIGGIAAGEGNVIATAGRAGVAILASATGIAIRGNTMIGAGMPIDLGGTGPTPNDPGDADTGPNHLQNYPVLRPTNDVNGSTIVSGWFDGAPSTSYVIDFYAAAACGDGGASGTRWIGTTTITTNAGGHAELTVPIAGSHTFVAATATSPSNDTSEVSGCATLNIPVAGAPGLLLLAAGLAVAAVLMMRR